MLNRNSVRAALAAMAIVFSLALNNNARGSFQDGDFITHAQADWGDDQPFPPSLAAVLLANNYDDVYASTFHVILAGIPGTAGYSIAFTNVDSLVRYLPSVGPSGPLSSDLVNPSTSSSGYFGGEVLALTINIDFSDFGVTGGNLGIPFGDLQLQNFLHSQFNLNGLTVRQVLEQANNLLGGGSSLFYSIDQLDPLIGKLNSSFGDGSVSQFAMDHLRVVPGIPGDYNANGIVDAADYVVWRKNPGGIYSQDDYNLWRANFGQTAGRGSVATTNAIVPEPGTAALLMLTMIGWCLRQCRAA